MARSESVVAAIPKVVFVQRETLPLPGGFHDCVNPGSLGRNNLAGQEAKSTVCAGLQFDPSATRGEPFNTEEYFAP